MSPIIRPVHHQSQPISTPMPPHASSSWLHCSVQVSTPIFTRFYPSFDPFSIPGHPGSTTHHDAFATHPARNFSPCRTICKYSSQFRWSLVDLERRCPTVERPIDEYHTRRATATALCPTALYRQLDPIPLTTSPGLARSPNPLSQAIHPILLIYLCSPSKTSHRTKDLGQSAVARRRFALLPSALDRHTHRFRMSHVRPHP